jgi:tetratricopeptide (TPR) repeat protein
MTRLLLRALSGLALTAAFVAAVHAQTPPAATPLQSARAHLAAGRFAQADTILEALVAQSPNNFQAWLALGNARRGLGRIDDAVTAFRRVMASPLRPQAAQALFTMYANAKRLDDAAPLLDTLRLLNAPDFSALVSTQGIENLRGDPRFALLFPDSTAFSPPFVEPVTIIHEWRGEAAGDEFGWIARSIGDVDADGVTDVVISATQNPPLGARAGKLYVYSGRSGALLWRKDGAPRAALGISVEAAGDVNLDGIPDVVAGAPGMNAVLVYSGRDGTELHRLRGDSADIDLGRSAAGIGDFNGDGYADILAGAVSANASTGRAYVFSGRDGSRLLTLNGQRAGESFGSAVAGGGGLFVIGAASGGPNQRGRIYMYNRLDTLPAFTQDADSTGAAFGAMFTSILGDVDMDGTTDVFVSDFVNSANGPSSGRVYIFSGRTGALIRTITGDGGAFGTSASDAGDVDGDGAADLVVGSWQWRTPAWSGGRVQVFSGGDGRLLRTITSRVPGETLGFDAVGVGDVNGDGAVDYLLTSAYSLVNGPRSGRVYIISGR